MTTLKWVHSQLWDKTSKHGLKYWRTFLRMYLYTKRWQRYEK